MIWSYEIRYTKLLSIYIRLGIWHFLPGMNSKTSVKTRIWTRVPDNCFIIGFRHFHFSFILIAEEKKRCRDNQAKTNDSCKLSLGWRNHVSFTFNVIISNAFESAHNHVTTKLKFVRFLCLKYQYSIDGFI